MKRVPAVVTAVAASTVLASAILAAGTGITGPASASAAASAGPAAPKPGVRHQVAHLKKPAKKTPAAAAPVKILSQDASGQYVSEVTCDGKAAPAPVRLNQPRTPIRLTGSALTPATARALARPRTYRQVYRCTIIVEKKAPVPAGKGGGVGTKCELPGKGGRLCTSDVTLNTGLGGAAHSVAGHHPKK